MIGRYGFSAIGSVREDWLKDIGTMSDSTTQAMDDSELPQSRKVFSEPSTDLEWTREESQGFQTNLEPRSFSTIAL